MFIDNNITPNESCENVRPEQESHSVRADTWNKKITEFIHSSSGAGAYPS